MKYALPAKAIFLALLSIILVACSKGSETPEAAKVETAPAAEASVEIAEHGEAVANAANTTLAGTNWRLVKIMSMDDTTYAPDDPSVYTLDFAADGTINVVADCNRATGPWTSESAGQLQFGPLAATTALCPPESLHDRYLAEFQWVRSYVMRDGHLFLATMTDGSIIEFEPVISE